MTASVGLFLDVFRCQMSFLTMIPAFAGTTPFVLLPIMIFDMWSISLRGLFKLKR